MRGPARNERGFALPAVIFLVALLTLLLTGGLSRVQADRQIAEAGEATADAFAIAQSGLQHYLGTRTSRPPDGDSVRINLTGGYANVIAHLAHAQADTTEITLYLIRSTGFVINPAAGSTPQARRTVAQFADWQTGSVERRGALTAANGVRRDWVGGSRTISGVDACGVEPTIPGLRTDAAAGDPTAVTFVGNPPLIEEGGLSGPLIAHQTEIDWVVATSPTFIPDYTSFQNNDLTYPIQRVAGDLVLNGTFAGTGILIVPGNLYLQGVSFHFDGLIIAGGEIEFEADEIVIEGLVYSGMDEHPMVGGAPPRSDIATSTNTLLDLRFNSCKVNQALVALTGMAPVANGWLDNWAEY